MITTRDILHKCKAEGLNPDETAKVLEELAGCDCANCDASLESAIKNNRVVNNDVTSQARMEFQDYARVRTDESSFTSFIKGRSLIEHHEVFDDFEFYLFKDKSVIRWYQEDCPDEDVQVSTLDDFKKDQTDYLRVIQETTEFNICTCGDCGEPIIFKGEKEELCLGCHRMQWNEDCPDMAFH